MKKKYVKPNICAGVESKQIENIAPLAPAAALVGGYVAGRLAKQAVEVKIEIVQKHLGSVIG